MDSNFIENGYRPPTEVQDTLSPNQFNNPTHEDQIHFFKSESSPIPELQRVANATVLISEAQDCPGGSGVIISYGGKKYLVTATHVIGDLLAEEYEQPEVVYHWRDSTGQLQKGILKRGEQAYDSITARKRGLKTTDSAIFPFNGDNDGVEISDLEVGFEGNQTASAVGFPGEFHEAWKNSVKPLISVGHVFRDKPKEITPALRAIIEQYKSETIRNESRDLKVYYTGRVVPGNSGGPLVDSQGKVIGVCSGPRGTFGREDGIEKFSDFRPILRDISQRAA